jgi:hypothetical protein
LVGRGTSLTAWSAPVLRANYHPVLFKTATLMARWLSTVEDGRLIVDSMIISTFAP